MKAWKMVASLSALVRGKKPTHIPCHETFLSRVHWTGVGWPSLDAIELNPSFKEMQAGSFAVMKRPEVEPLNGLIPFVCVRDPFVSLSSMLRDERGR